MPMLPLLVQAEEPDLIFYCGGSMRGQIRQEEYETARRFHSKPDLVSPVIQKEIQETVFIFNNCSWLWPTVKSPSTKYPG